MKSIFKIFILGLFLSFMGVGQATPNDERQDVAKESVFVVDIGDDALESVYQIIKAEAPGVFTNDELDVEVTLYGKCKEQAYTYLTEQRRGKNININGICFRDNILAVSICKIDKHTNLYKSTERAKLAVKSRLPKKWVRG